MSETHTLLLGFIAGVTILIGLLDSALGRLHEGTGGIGPVAGYAALFFLGLAVGLMSLVYYERWLAGRARPRSLGPGAMSPGELTAAPAGIAS